MDKTAQYAKAAEFYKQALAEGADPDEARAAYDAAVGRIAAMPDAPVDIAVAPPAQKPLPATQGYPRVPGSLVSDPHASQQLAGATSAAINGATFGFGDNMAEMIRPGIGKQMRVDAAAFNDEHPILSPAIEIGAGVATGAGLKNIAAKGLPYVSKAADAINKSAMLQGGLAGIGANDDGSAGNKLASGATNAVIGGALGRILGGVTGGAAKVISRARGERADTWGGRQAVKVFAKRLGKGNITPEVLAQAGDATTGSDARIIDNAGVAGERLGRSVRTWGGAAGDKMDDWATKRLRTAPDRMVDAVYQGESPDNIHEMTQTFIELAREKSTPFYERFRRLPAVNDPKIEEQLAGNKLFRDAQALVVDKLSNMEPADKAAILGPHWASIGPDEIVRLRTPAYLDAVKKAAGDIVYSRKTALGGFFPDAWSIEKKALSRFTNRLGEVFKESDGTPVYNIARGMWSGEIEMQEALQDGVKAIAENVHSDKIPSMMKGMTPAEIDLFKRGAKAQMRDVIERGGLKPGSTEHRAFLKRVDAIFQEDANPILTQIRDEVAGTRTAQFVQGGSSTASTVADAVNPLALESSNVWGSGIYNPTRAFTNVAGRIAASKVGAPLSASARNAMADMLLSKANDPKVVKLLMKELAAQATGKTVRRTLQGPLAAETAYGFFRRPQE